MVHYNLKFLLSSSLRRIKTLKGLQYKKIKKCLKYFFKRFLLFFPKNKKIAKKLLAILYWEEKLLYFLQFQELLLLSFTHLLTQVCSKFKDKKVF